MQLFTHSKRSFLRTLQDVITSEKVNTISGLPDTDQLPPLPLHLTARVFGWAFWQPSPPSFASYQGNEKVIFSRSQMKTKLVRIFLQPLLQFCNCACQGRFCAQNAAHIKARFPLGPSRVSFTGPGAQRNLREAFVKLFFLPPCATFSFCSHQNLSQPQKGTAIGTKDETRMRQG